MPCSDRSLDNFRNNMSVQISVSPSAHLVIQIVDRAKYGLGPECLTFGHRECPPIGEALMDIYLKALAGGLKALAGEIQALNDNAQGVYLLHPHGDVVAIVFALQSTDRGLDLLVKLYKKL